MPGVAEARPQEGAERYGHLMPGNESEAAERLDAYLARATDRTEADVF